jgi:hypothetical protein
MANDMEKTYIGGVGKKEGRDGNEVRPGNSMAIQFTQQQEGQQHQ